MVIDAVNSPDIYPFVLQTIRHPSFCRMSFCNQKDFKSSVPAAVGLKRSSLGQESDYGAPALGFSAPSSHTSMSCKFRPPAPACPALIVLLFALLSHHRQPVCGPERQSTITSARCCPPFCRPHLARRGTRPSGRDSVRVFSIVCNRHPL